MCPCTSISTLCRFYFHLWHLRKSAQIFLDPSLNSKVEHPEFLGEFDDKDGYNGKPPSEATLSPWFRRRVQMAGGPCTFSIAV